MPDGIAAPLPLSADTALGRLLIALEAPECGCKLGPACQVAIDLARGKHTERVCPGPRKCQDCPPGIDLENPCEHLEGAEHDVPLQVWESLLCDYDRAGMAQRPAPPP